MNITYQVDDMSCQHCVNAITKAVQATDGTARVAVDLSTHRVRIESASVAADALRSAIADAGYTPVAVADALGPAPSSGCGCGGGGCRAAAG